MKTIIDEQAACCRLAAEHIRNLLQAKPDAVFALAAGRSTAPVYAQLVKFCSAGELSLEQARVFAVTEFEGVREEQSCRAVLERELIKKTDLAPGNCYFLSADTAEGYDAAIRAVGGLDLAVLGLGDNAHIGYNEPATPFDSHTHRQKLTDATRRQLAARFGGEDQAPAYAWTMGVKTLTEARQILLLAFGEEKAQPAFKMLYARTDSTVPAAFLQVPLNVTIYLDPAAAAKI